MAAACFELVMDVRLYAAITGVWLVLGLEALVSLQALALPLTVPIGGSAQLALSAGRKRVVF